MAASKRYSAEWALAGRFPCVTCDSGLVVSLCHLEPVLGYGQGGFAASLHSTCRSFISLFLFFPLWVRIWKLCVLGKGRKMTPHSSVVPFQCHFWTFVFMLLLLLFRHQVASDSSQPPWTVGCQASLSLPSPRVCSSSCAACFHMYSHQEWIKIYAWFRRPQSLVLQTSFVRIKLCISVNAASFPWDGIICAIVSHAELDNNWLRCDNYSAKCLGSMGW